MTGRRGVARPRIGGFLPEFPANASLHVPSRTRPGRRYREPRLAHLAEIIEHASHLLPAQGPITVFIHHNTLHALEDLPFDEAVKKGSQAFGCQPYMTEDRYRADLLRGRIGFSELQEVLEHDLGVRARDPIPCFGTRLELRPAMLQYPLRTGPTEELVWYVAEADDLRKIREEVSSSVRSRMIAETRRWVVRDLRGGAAAPRQGAPPGVDGRHSPGLADLFRRSGGSTIEDWGDDRWERFTLQALWRVCCDGVRDFRPFTAPAEPVARHRDNTCGDSVTFHDVDRIPEFHRAEFALAGKALREACEWNAHERSRSAPLGLSFVDAPEHVEERSEDLAEARPELGHASNAIIVVGRREWTRGLFLDRRAFPTSYDPSTDDAEQSIHTRILQAVSPVCSGISLEYYFSNVDNVGFDCGTKLPHNVASLLGVMDGAASDLRTGLPWQMVEIHEPVRSLFLIETTPEAMMRIIDRQPGIGRLCRDGWVHLAVLHPTERWIAVFADGALGPPGRLPPAPGEPAARPGDHPLRRGGGRRADHRLLRLPGGHPLPRLGRSTYRDWIYRVALDRGYLDSLLRE